MTPSKNKINILKLNKKAKNKQKKDIDLRTTKSSVLKSLNQDPNRKFIIEEYHKRIFEPYQEFK